MGRKSKNKSKKEGPTGGTRTYLKVLAVFSCSNDKCKRQWNSAHGWNPEDDVPCEFCGAEAEIAKVVDEMLELDNYYCPNPGCNGYHWQSIHDSESNRQECDICGAMVTRSGTQSRFGRHYWFSCPGGGCPAWEDFSITPQRTQRCGKCKSRGDITGLKKLRPVPLEVLRQRRQLGAGRGEPENHKAELCDMCQDLIAQGKGRTCMSFRKVLFKVEDRGDGTLNEYIVSASN